MISSSSNPNNESIILCGSLLQYFTNSSQQLLCFKDILPYSKISFRSDHSEHGEGFAMDYFPTQKSIPYQPNFQEQSLCGGIFYSFQNKPKIKDSTASKLR